MLEVKEQALLLAVLLRYRHTEEYGEHTFAFAFCSLLLLPGLFTLSLIFARFCF